MLQLGELLVRPLHILSPVHWVGVEPMTLRDETSGHTTMPVGRSWLNEGDKFAQVGSQNIAFNSCFLDDEANKHHNKWKDSIAK